MYPRYMLITNGNNFVIFVLYFPIGPLWVGGGGGGYLMSYVGFG